LIYYAAFIPGLQDLVRTVICERLEDVKIRRLTDGAVIFETGVSYDRLNFFCFNNIFALIDIFEQKNPGQNQGPAAIRAHIEKIIYGRKSGGSLRPAAQALISENNKQIQSFRLVCSAENKPVSIDEKIKREMENYIEQHSSLELNRSKPDTEFWFLYRNEGFCCFLKRLTNNRQGEKSLHPGELSPQLAWSLCRMAELKHGETIADPFCGYGSIPSAACRHFPIGKFYASDIDPCCIRISKSKLNSKDSRCEIRRTDFRSVSDFLQSGSLDAVITDPPWGMYRETDIPLQDLYDRVIVFLQQFLKDSGRAVILSAAVNELETAAGKNRAVMINEKIPVLVSGKKAVAFILKKTENK